MARTRLQARCTNSRSSESHGLDHTKGHDADTSERAPCYVSAAEILAQDTHQPHPAKHRGRCFLRPLRAQKIQPPKRTPRVVRCASRRERFPVQCHQPARPTGQDRASEGKAGCKPRGHQRSPGARPTHSEHRESAVLASRQAARESRSPVWRHRSTMQSGLYQPYAGKAPLRDPVHHREHQPPANASILCCRINRDGTNTCNHRTFIQTVAAHDLSSLFCHHAEESRVRKHE